MITGIDEYSLRYDGFDRRYLVYNPISIDHDLPVPLVIALHGGGGNADQGIRYFQLNEKSEEEGFIVVYPEGTGRILAGKLFGTWNAGRCCKYAKDNNVDDTGFINTMMEKMMRDYNIDESRIYVIGMSNGAQMAYRLACELSDKIAAIAPVGSVGTYDECEPKNPVPVFMVDGTDDPCSPYNGGNDCGGCFAEFWKSMGIIIKDPVSYECDSVNDYARKWSIHNRCLKEKKVIYHKGNTTCEAYGQCSQNASVVICTIYGGGHTWPGRTTYSITACQRNPKGILCKKWVDAAGPLMPEFNANDHIWDFFTDQTLS